MKRNAPRSTDRRTFLGTLATGAAALSLGTLAAPLQAVARKPEAFLLDDDPEVVASTLLDALREYDPAEPRVENA